MVKTLNRADVERLAQIVREETGNQVQEKNYPMIESRIRTHIMKLGLPSIDAYWQHFKANEEVERDALQSLMTTHYTFFFREFAHFEVLEKWLEKEGPRLKERYNKDKTPVRVWSAACSRGQEVYSLAMFLTKKLQIPFEIVGTDIDAESVNYARNGVYPIKEVNTIPNHYLAGFWKKGTGSVKEFAAVHPSLRTSVRFEPLNLLELQSWADSKKFDVIFCRNVFIYFSEENVKKIAQSLADRLNPEGLLVSGMSEPLRFDGWNLPMVGPSCYVNQKGGPVAPMSTPTAASAASNAKPVSAATSGNVAPIAGVPKKIRVLCVDDSLTIQLLIKKIFAQDAAFDKVDVAVNGRDAREKLDKNKYDLITLDIHMPEVNGIEFLERFYNRKNDPPVLMVSSVNRTDVDLATKSLALGAFDYVEKPAMNNLQKSAGELLTKAKMALRSKEKPEEAVGAFDQSISQKIVVPDASLCVRVVTADAETLPQLEQVVRAQHAEYRSPALLILFSGPTDKFSVVEAELLRWTNRKVVSVRGNQQHLKPNHVYVVETNSLFGVLDSLKVKSASLQFLNIPQVDLKNVRAIPGLQVLADERISGRVPEIERQYGVKVSDITPATSFASLSVEYFANLRKAS